LNISVVLVFYCQKSIIVAEIALGNAAPCPVCDAMFSRFSKTPIVMGGWTKR